MPHLPRSADPLHLGAVSVGSSGIIQPHWLQLRDLLVDKPRRLEIRSTAASGLNVPDATQVRPVS